MSVEPYQIIFHVFICASYLEILNFFGKSFPFLFLFFIYVLDFQNINIKGKPGKVKL
jgi:hypothetical protein